MGRLWFSLFVVFFIVYHNEAKIYDRCSLATELHDKGVPADQINNFVCLIEHNSFDTSWTGGPYGDGTRNFGIFQINNKNWCDIGQDGGSCDIDCNLFKDDDITDDLACAKKILRQHKFQAWWVWRSHCKTNLPDLSYCYSGASVDDELA